MKKQKRKKKIHFRKHKFWVQYTTKSTTCKYCHAKRFKHEPKGFCCSEEEISLVENNVPQELHELFTSDSKWAIEFKKYIRTYDNTFAFTTFGVKYDKDLCRRNKGIYTFQVQGQVCHYINELLPSNSHPSYLQLYFYDSKHEIENRFYVSNKMNSCILEKIIVILKVNQYSNFFLYLI